MFDLRSASWQEHPDNPLVEPPRPEWMIADPTVLTPAASPDGRWHMFANSVGFIRHLTSSDGIEWEERHGRLWQGIRPYIYVEEGTYYLYYERFRRPWQSGVVVRTSSDLEGWSDPTVLLAAAPGTHDGHLLSYLGNPCLVKHADTYRLYVSHGWVFLRDCLYFEPRYVSMAEGPTPTGPFVRRAVPLLGTESRHPYRNLGAGSVKLLSREGGGYWVFHNGIYRDAEGRSRSAIHLLESRDGLHFHEVHDGPIVAPDEGWKRAFVYAFDPVWYDGELRLYFNARDGWFRGAERIGLAIGRP